MSCFCCFVKDFCNCDCVGCEKDGACWNCVDFFRCPDVDFSELSPLSIRFMEDKRKKLFLEKRLEKLTKEKAAKEAAEKAKEKFEPAPSEVRPKFNSDYERFVAWLAEEESFL